MNSPEAGQLVAPTHWDNLCKQVVQKHWHEKIILSDLSPNFTPSAQMIISNNMVTDHVRNVMNKMSLHAIYGRHARGRKFDVGSGTKWKRYTENKECVDRKGRKGG